MMSSDSDGWRPITRSRAASSRRRRKARRNLRSPSGSRGTPSRSRGTPSRSPTPYSQNGHCNEEERNRRSRSRSPSRRRAPAIGRSRSPTRRRALRIGRRRSRSPSRRRAPRTGGSRSPGRRRAPRSCRSRSRTRSEECEDRRCCRPRQAGDDREPDGDEGYMSEYEEGFFVRIDRYDRLFTCAQCHNLLSSPVYECAEGHVTCATCHGSANDGAERQAQCHRCGSANYGRSRAAAEWLRSIRFACNNYNYGCPAFHPRHQIEAHERACRYAPCFCPARRCDFPGGPADALERHLTASHGWAVVTFRYGQPFHASVVHSARSLLHAEDDGALFHLSAIFQRDGGTVMSMIRIRPDNAAEEEFTYEVKTPQAEGLRHRLLMQSTVWGTSLRYGRADANTVRLTVPDDMFPPDGPQADSIEVRIDKVAPAGAGNN